MNRRQEQNSEAIIGLFNQLFEVSEATVLAHAPTQDPLYLPAQSPHGKHQLLFAHRSFQSALHEISHWCIAGPQRRLQEDFGYWYIPDGRTPSQQKAFLQVETKPQALEWVFSSAAERPFYISLDNLSGDQLPCADFFKSEVRDQAIQLLRQGLPARAERFRRALVAHYSSESRFQDYWRLVEKDQTLPL